MLSFQFLLLDDTKGANLKKLQSHDNPEKVKTYSGIFIVVLV